MNVVVQCVIGGSSVQDDVDMLQKNPPHVVVGTPGRINQLMEQNYLIVNDVVMLIVDEADEMLKIDF